ncbi:MAG: prolyl oligopeptidase family serine peptidase [Mycobacteriaceae bacterium]
MTYSTSSPAARYPEAERLDLVEALHGYQVADPYRWLEDQADQRTTEFHAAQDALTGPALAALPGRTELGAELRSLLDTGSVSAPTWRAGRSFATRRVPGQEHSVLLVTEPDGAERVLVDPGQLDPTGLTTLDAWTPSREGDRLAYQLSVGGDEESLLHVIDVDTGHLLDGPLDRCRYSPVAWLPGGAEFFYVRRLPPGAMPGGEEQFHRRVLRHRVGADADTDVELSGPGMYDDPTFYFGARVSADGRWLVVDASPGTAPRTSLWIADLAGDGELVTVLTQDDAIQANAWVEDGRLLLHTTDAAPRWRLCAADPTNPGRDSWRELVAEDPESVLDGVRVLQPGGQLILARSHHAVAELHVHDTNGTETGAVAMPGPGSFSGLTVADRLTPQRGGQVWFGWTDFTTPTQVYRSDCGMAVEPATADHPDEPHLGAPELVASAPGALELAGVHTQQLVYTSADGTPVRMFVVSAAADPDRPRPTLLTGYGGFSVSREPAYTATALAWVRAGGVWALASLRGGAEEGEAWHRDGMRENKQNVFDDFHAAAESLVERGWTSPDQLAIMGGSNGGLLVGAALTQRPELYRAVVCSAPLLDMVRYERFALGRTWNAEYGTADKPEELAWLLGYSPYHHVVPGTEYPAVLVTVFASDTRVDPVHGAKFVAALQHASTADPVSSPVLLRTERDVGHGPRSVSRTAALATDQLAFLALHTSLDLTTLGRTLNEA